MATPSTEALRAALRDIKDPASGRDIVSAGLVEAINLRDGLVQVTLLTDRAHAAAMEPVRHAAQALLARQPGITNATAIGNFEIRDLLAVNIVLHPILSKFLLQIAGKNDTLATRREDSQIRTKRREIGVQYDRFACGPLDQDGSFETTANGQSAFDVGPFAVG